MADEADNSSGSTNRVAYDLWRSHLRFLPEDYTLEQSFDLFEQCRRACVGGRYDISKLLK